VLARVSLSFFSLYHDNVSVAWPASGLAFTALLVGGRKYWPGVLVGGFATNLSLGSPILAAALVALGATLEPLLGTWLLNNSKSFDSALRHPRDFLLLTAVGAISATLSALIGVTTLWAANIIPQPAAASALLNWWQGDFFGIVLFVPLILVWKVWPRTWFQRDRVLETIACFGLLMLVGQIVFLDLFSDSIGLIARSYWLFLFATWAAVRFGRHGVTLVVSLTSIQALLGIARGTGLFANDFQQTHMMNFWLFIMALAVVGISLALVISQRKQTEAALTESDAFLRVIINSMPDQVAVIDRDGVIVQVNESWRRFSLENSPVPGKPTPHTSVGTNYIDVCRASIGSHAEGSDAAHEGIQAVLEGRLPAFSLDYPCHSPEQQRWFSMRVSPLGSNRGGAVIAHTNITDLMLASNALRQSEDLLKSMTAAVPGVVYQFSRTPEGERKFVYFSKGIENLYEVTAEAGYRDHNLLTECILAEDRASHRESVERSAMNLAFWEHEHRIRTPNGKLKWVRGEAMPERQEDGSILWNGILTDITKREEVEQQLKASQERLQLALSGGELGLWDWNIPSGEVLYSEHWFSMLGLPKGETKLDLESWIKLIHPDDLASVNAALESHLKGQAPTYECEHRVRHQNGRWLWLLDRGKVVEWDKTGAPVRAVGTYFEVTQRKQAELELARSNSRYQGILHNMMDSYWRVDKDGRIVEANFAIAKMHGYSAEELLQKSVSDFEVIESEEETRKHIETIKREGHDLFESRHQCKDGRVIDLEISANLALDDPGHVDAFHRDITERKLATEALRKSEESLRLSEKQMAISQEIGSTGSWIYNLETDGIWGSAEGLRIFGYPPIAREFPIQEIESCIPDRERVHQALMDLLSEGRVYDLEYTILPADGSTPKTIHSIGRLEKDAQGNPFRVLGFIQDVTEQKKAEVEILRSNAELEQFSYAISHDMRQPLRMISSYMRLLEKDLAEHLDAEKRQHFNFAIDGAKRMDAMMLGLLEYSRIGRKGEPPTWVESRAVLDDALIFLQPAIAEAKAIVRVEGEWPRVLVSNDEMLRLMQNLIGNALKFLIAGRTPEVTVTSEVIGKEWRLSVADNGVGILPDQISRLFQVFQRLQSRADYEGTGVGLALCRKIAEHHGGRIWVESEGEGKGSKFCVALPL
jgi:PAS domain S-box-containing protein